MSNSPPPKEVLLALVEAAGQRYNTDLHRTIDTLYLYLDAQNADHAHQLAENFTRRSQLRGTPPHPFQPSPAPEHLCGGIPVGALMHYDEVVGIPFDGHKYIAGSVQTGKTTLAFLIALHAYAAGRQVIVFDPLGRFRQITGSLPGSDFYVVSAPNFQVNPFDPPPGANLVQWLGWRANIEREIAYYRKNTENFWMDTALSVKEVLSLPTFRDALQRREPRQWGSEMDSWERVSATVESVMNALPNLAVPKSRGLAEIFSRRVVIFDWSTVINNSHKKYLTLIALAWLLASRPAEAAGWNTLAIFDEVHQLASKDIVSSIDTGEPFFNVPVRTAGNRGISMLTIDQNPAYTHPVVRANAAVKILSRLDGGEDKHTMSNDFSLNREQQAYLSLLQKREALVKLPVLDPFLVRVPDVEYVEG